ncbi:MAG: DinB family protein [Balneolaceae bacterium]|nr:DinB family protein [Balneolaceae bacterium]
MSDPQTNTSQKANDLADRIIMGAVALEGYAEKLSTSDWQRKVAGDGRTIGVVVHHVASSYPVEIDLARLLASGQPITGVTMEVVDQMNAKHAQENISVEKKETLELLRSNSKVAADSVRAFTDTELNQAAAVSLNADAPLTTQFFIEDHALRHSFHHLARIRATLNK